MLSSVQVAASDYADVFMQAPSSHVALPISIGFIGAVIVFYSVLFVGRNYLYPLTAGFLILFSGGVIGLISLMDHLDVRNSQVKNMSANIEHKYGAEMTPESNHKPYVREHLDQPQPYVLKFSDGSVARYTMYFEKPGEPVIVEAPSAPSPKELNQKAAFENK